MKMAFSISHILGRTPLDWLRHDIPITKLIVTALRWLHLLMRVATLSRFFFITVFILAQYVTKPTTVTCYSVTGLGHLVLSVAGINPRCPLSPALLSAKLNALTEWIFSI